MVRVGAFIAALVLCPAWVSAQQPCSGDARLVVNEIYRNVLERSADRGSNQMVQRLNSGTATVRDLVREVAMSSEYAQRFVPGGSSEANARAVSGFYRHLLGREPDPGGLRDHVEGLQKSGAAAVVDSLLNSTEYQQAFGDNGVPGSGVRYCGATAPGASRTTTQGASRNTGGIRFREMDTNGDGRIARAEWRGSRQSFDVHDWNNDGVLSGDEVRTGARRQAPAFDEQDFDPGNADRFDSWTAESFASIDHNRDNRITENEWHYGYEAFRRVDRNGDDVVSRAEFLATEPDDDREDSFENLDANGDGRVDRNEWHGSADAFKWLDRNNNGVLNRNEVVGDQGAARDRFASLDINRDGRLTMDEWHWSRRSFDQQDANGDGVVTRREFSGGPVPPGGR